MAFNFSEHERVSLDHIVAKEVRSGHGGGGMEKMQFSCINHDYTAQIWMYDVAQN